jgi:hypothetical protein
MWRFVFLAALGLVVGTRARSERGAVFMSLFFGLLYGGIEALGTAAITDSVSSGRLLVIFGLGLVMALPVYAVAEIWRRSRNRAMVWLRRFWPR